MKRIRAWQAWLFIGFLIVIIFIWGIHILDLPHYLLGAKSAELHWEESIIETTFSVSAFLVCWNLIDYYEHKWLQANAELQKLASTDSLTGALNRRAFLEKAEGEFLRAKRFNRAFTCSIIDLDGFKSINDNFGHLSGDRVLIEFIRVAMNNVRSQDFIGRLGGDEFGIGFVETGEADAYIIINRIREQWQKENIFSDDGRSLSINFSTGIASAESSDGSLTDCIRRTDEALYEAKHAGNNRIELA